jgi:hypothetical protein
MQVSNYSTPAPTSAQITNSNYTPKVVNLTSILTNNTNPNYGISSDGTNVWIGGTNLMYQVQCSNCTLIRTINVPTPNGISSDGTNVWVSVWGGSISQIQCSTGNLVKTIDLPNNPFSVFSDGTSVWAPCDNNFISQIQCSTGSIIRTINTLSGPVSAVSDGTNCYVLVNTGSTVNDIMVINSSSGALSNLNLPGNTLGGISIDQNNIWYTYSSNNQSYLKNYSKNSSQSLNVNYSNSSYALNLLCSDGTYVWINSTGGNAYNTYQVECSTGKVVNTITSGVQCIQNYNNQISCDGKYVWIIGKGTNGSPSFVQIIVNPTNNEVTPTLLMAPKPQTLPYILSLTNCLTIWQGTNPSNTTQFIWNPTGSISQSTSGPGIPNLQPNPTYATTKGKSSNPWISSGFSFAKGDFIGNNNGSLYLIMDMSGNLNLCTTSYSYYSGVKLGNNYYGGGKSTNAIYQVSEVGNTSLLNNIYYIDADANSHLYTSEYTGPSSNYTMFPNINASGNNISQINNSSLEACQQQCDNTQDCAGFVFDASNNICFTKNSGMWPYGGNQNMSLTSNTYLKMNQLNSVPVGVSTSTNNIDSYTAQKYNPSTNSVINPYSLANEISSNLIYLASIENQINALASQISNENVNFENNQLAIFEQAITDKQAIEDFLQDYTIVEKAIKKVDIQEYLLKDSTIKALQENYHYLLWSILAIGIVIIGVNVLKKKN